VDVLRPFGILEMVRTGQVVMRRGIQESSLPKGAQDDPRPRQQKTGPELTGAGALVEAEHPGSV
jgi:hypothetical protein